MENIYVVALQKSFPAFVRENRIWFWALTAVVVLQVFSGGPLVWASLLIWLASILLLHRDAYFETLKGLQEEARAESARRAAEEKKRAETEALRQKQEQERKAQEEALAREEAERVRRQREKERAENQEHQSRMLAMHMANAQRAQEEKFRAFQESVVKARMGKPRDE